MHVLHVMPSVARTFGGPTQSLIGYVGASSAMGITSSIAAPAVADADRAWLREQIGDAQMHFFPGISFGTFMASPALLGWLASQRKQFDLIHVHGLLNLTSSLAARITRHRHQPVIVRPFGTLSRYTFTHRRTWLKRRYFHVLDRPNLRRAHGLHFTTNEERDEAQWHDLDFACRSFVVPPPLHLVSMDAAPPIRPGTGHVLYLGRLHPKKNVESLLRAWPHIAQRIRGARLTIAGDGDGDYVASLKTLAYELGIGPRIAFPGFVHGKEKTELLNTANVFVLPSFQENFGVAVLEAIAAGVPVAIAPEVQLAAFVRQHRLGRVAATDPETLAHSVISILNEPSLATHCQAKGPHLVQNTFSPGAIGRQLLSMYETVLDH